MIHSGNQTAFKTTFVIDDGTKPYSYTITKPAKNASATARVASADAPTASGLGNSGIGAVDRSDHGNDNSQPPADVKAFVREQQGRKTAAVASGAAGEASTSAPTAKGLRSKNSQ